MVEIGFLASQISAAAAMRCFCRSVTSKVALSSRARFHLDENQGVAAGGDDIDFA
jgi:hypothetical protein